MKKKVIAALLCGALALTALAGCSSNDSGTSGSDTTAADDAADADDTQAATDGKEDSSKDEDADKDSAGSGDAAASQDVVEITFWDQNADTIRTEIFSKLIADFENENPNIKVNFVPVPSDDAKSKYDVAIQSNTAPDCGGIYQYWMTDFIIQDALVSLDEYIADWDQAGKTLDIYNDSIREMSMDGKQYSLAHTTTLPAVYYNVGILEENGVDVPTTWDEVFNAVEATTDTSNGVYGFSLRGGPGNSQQFEQMMYQYSGLLEMFDEDGNSTANDPKHVELLEKFAAIYNVYTPESDITNGSTEMISAFDSGSATMIFHNLGSYAQHVDTLGDGNFGALTTLKSQQDTNVIISNGATCLAVFEDSEHPEEAFKFISYLCEQEANSYFNEAIGQIPMNTDALQDDWIQNEEPIRIAAASLMDDSTIMATLPINISGYFDLHSNVLVENFQNVLLGNMTAQEFLDMWAEEMTVLKQQYDAYIQTQS